MVKTTPQKALEGLYGQTRGAVIGGIKSVLKVRIPLLVSIQNSCLIDHYYDGMDWTINHMDGNWTFVGNATEH